MRVLSNRRAIVTGGGQGLGLAISAAYVEAGCSIAICGRAGAVLDRAMEALRSSAESDQVVFHAVADVSQPADVERFVESAAEAMGGIDVLVNNAGIQGPMGRFDENDWTAWKQTVEVNLLGPVLTCRAAVPHMIRAGGGKIIQISGGGATKPMPSFSAYAASKAAVIRFVETMADELRGDRIDCNAIAPGMLRTRMLRDVVDAGPERVGEEYHANVVRKMESGEDSIERAAALAVFLASSKSDGISGRLLSAVWDNWDSLESHRDELMKSDVYSLRRIVPEDRGFSW